MNIVSSFNNNPASHKPVSVYFMNDKILNSLIKVIKFKKAQRMQGKSASTKACILAQEQASLPQRRDRIKRKGG